MFRFIGPSAAVSRNLEETSRRLMRVQPTSYRCLQSLLRLESMRPPPGTPTPPWTRDLTPVAYQRLSQLLASHPDPQFTVFIQRGISSGSESGSTADLTL